MLTSHATVWHLRRLVSARPALIAVSLLVSIWSAGLLAQNGAVIVGPVAAPPPAAATQKCTLTGSVIDSVTGEPVRKALVQLNGIQRRSAFADSDGRFLFEAVPSGSYAVFAQKPGYFNDNELQLGGTPPIEVGANSTPAVIKLTPESAISGTVTSSTGIPLEQVNVSLTYVDIREGRRHWDQTGSTPTDEDGRYRFARLRPGRYYISTAPHTPVAETTLDQPPKSGFPSTYFASAPDLASASPVELSAGEQADADFSLSEVPVYRVSGTISGYAANQGVSLQLLDQSGVLIPTGYQFSAENGRFDLPPLAAGSYVLRASSAANANQQVRAELPFHLAGDLHNLHLALAPAPVIPVVVRMEGEISSATKTSANVHGAPIGPPVSVRLISTGPGAHEAFASPENPQDPQTISLRDVEPGRYTAVVEGRESWYVASADYGEANLLNEDLVVLPSAASAPLNIVLRNDSSLISGTVNVPDTFKKQVFIVAVQERLSRVAPATTFWVPSHDPSTPSPEFSLGALAPGEYLVFAFDQPNGLEYSNREVLDKYSSHAVRVSLASGQRAKVTLDLIRSEGGAD